MKQIAVCVLLKFVYLSCIAFRASATVIIRVIVSTGEAMKPHYS